MDDHLNEQNIFRIKKKHFIWQQRKGDRSLKLGVKRGLKFFNQSSYTENKIRIDIENEDLFSRFPSYVKLFYSKMHDSYMILNF